jgi:predicted transcriptional regulator
LGGIAIRIDELACLKLMHQKIAPNTFSMEHYSRVFHVLTLGPCTTKEIRAFTGLNAKVVDHILHNLEHNQLIALRDDRIHLNRTEEWLFAHSGGHR